MSTAPVTSHVAGHVPGHSPGAPPPDYEPGDEPANPSPRAVRKLIQAITCPEAPYSWTAEYTGTEGFRELLTVRDVDGDRFVARIGHALAYLVSRKAEPTRNGNHRTSGSTAAPAPPTPGAALNTNSGGARVCSFHGQMVPSKYGGFYCKNKMGDGSYCKEKSA